jgi:hypothetical protein
MNELGRNRIAALFILGSHWSLLAKVSREKKRRANLNEVHY